MIIKLQKILNLEETGILDRKTIIKAVEMKNDSKVISWLQEFLNGTDCPQKLKITGIFDADTKQVLTYFQKEYGWKFNMQNVTSEFDRHTMSLIAAYLQ